MAEEEELEIVEIKFEDIDLAKVERAYEAVAAALIESGVENTPTGWTEMFLVFLGLIDQLSTPDNKCKLCLADDVMHSLRNHFHSGTDDGESHAVH